LCYIVFGMTARVFRWIRATVLLVLIAGCATRPKVNPNIDWNSRVGAYTFDQAVAEIGKPDAIADFPEGRVADWILKRSPNVSFGFGIGGGSFGPHVGTGVGVGTSVTPPPHGEYLRLIFDQENKLKAWTHAKN
jgi:hypothetical protein